MDYVLKVTHVFGKRMGNIVPNKVQTTPVCQRNDPARDPTNEIVIHRQGNFFSSPRLVPICHGLDKIITEETSPPRYQQVFPGQSAEFHFAVVDYVL
jgi:hypothetical protein